MYPDQNTTYGTGNKSRSENSILTSVCFQIRMFQMEQSIYPDKFFSFMEQSMYPEQNASYGTEY